MIEAREAFVKTARQELNRTHCAKISPFCVARDYPELLERLDLFAEDIENALGTVTTATGYRSYLTEEGARAERESNKKFLLDVWLQPSVLSETYERRLTSEFLNHIGIAQKHLAKLEEILKSTAQPPEEIIVDAVRGLEGLANLVKVVPDFYKSISPEQQAAQDFVFRSHQPA